MQLGSLEKTASIWLHYLSAVTATKARLGSLSKIDKGKIKRVLDTVERPSSDQLSLRTASLNFQILEAVVVFPFRYPQAGAPGLMLGLSKLELLGKVSPSFTCEYSRFGLKAPARKILGGCAFNGAWLCCVDKCVIPSSALLVARAC